LLRRQPIITIKLMIKQLTFIIIFLIAGCGPTSVKKTLTFKKYSKIDLKYKNDTLFYFREDVKEGYGAGTSCGYINKNGDTIIPMNKYTKCFTDTFRTYAIVYDDKIDSNNIVGINRNGEIIFEAFLFDNWPDEPSEGLFRIIQNEKIGYANLHGEVIVTPKYKCAWPYKNGKAKVAIDCDEVKDEIEHITQESKSWFYINKKGEKIN
jgi:hypothetical protein